MFCSSFVWFYSQRPAKSKSPTAEVEKKSEKPLPEAKLIDLNSNLLSDEKFRKGKELLICVTPDCEACQKESEFLSGLTNNRVDVEFYGVTLFGKSKNTLESAQKKFPFKVYYDADSSLALQLKITKVP